MDRPRRGATKVTDFCRYHLSGDLDDQLQGKVGQTVEHFETRMAQLPEDVSSEQLREAITKQRQKDQAQQEELEHMTLRNEYEAGELRKKQLESAMEQLKEAREKMNAEHETSLLKLKEIADRLVTLDFSLVQEWLKQ